MFVAARHTLVHDLMRDEMRTFILSKFVQRVCVAMLPFGNLKK